MSGSVSSGVHFQEPKGDNEAPCKVTDPNCGSICGETDNLRILEQFQRVYADRLKRLDGDNELAMHTLKSWVHDLTEQNTMLVHTVEELERELLKRVDLMHDQLQKTSLVIKRNEHLAKREKNEVEINLRQQVQLLQNDISSLLDIINQAKEQGFWSVDSVKLHTVSKSQLMSTSPKRSIQQPHVASAAEKNVQSDVDNHKTQLAEKDEVIYSLLERIEEMKDIFTLTSKQVKQAIEAEQRSLQELATNQGTAGLNLQSKEDVDNSQHVEGVPPWVEERLKQQQEQVTSLISRVRELESNYDIVKLERDRLAGKLEIPNSPLINDIQVETKTISDPSMIILSKELLTTRQQFAEATKQVQMLALAVKDLEQKNYETKAALTTEVADKHDQVLELRKEIHDLETQVKEAKMQTSLKDIIIQGMRNELRVIRNKMRFLGVEVPIPLSSHPEKIPKRNKCREPKESLARSKQSTSDPALVHDVHLPGLQKSSRHRHGVKCSQSLPVLILPHSQYFAKSKSEPSQVEEPPKVKTKSKFCSNNYNEKSHSRHQYHFMECGENLIVHEQFNHSPEIFNGNMPKGICFDKNQENSKNFLEEGSNITSVTPCPRALPKISFMQYLEKGGIGENEHEVTPLGLASTTQTTLSDIYCERTPFYTTPHEGNCEGAALSSNIQACDSVVIAHIPPLPPNKIAHILIKTPSDIATCEKTIEMFNTSNHHTDESDVDVVNSCEICTLRKCASFTIPSSNSSFIPSSPKLHAMRK